MAILKNIVALLLLHQHLLHDAMALEYCLTESFSGRCEADHVILMTSATFGRMDLGRCVQRNYGNHVGCRADVMNQMDQACSGRRGCELSVSDHALIKTQPCPKDFASYLDAEFVCVKVRYGKRKKFKYKNQMKTRGSKK
ncbi:hypothetical protein HELRODRAFT_180640 [Helobdella robusta]|uniref:SUEL-type lectin domain-containing protein n=1 Tax=Helobdella robusta TaxID=6412 RepID=T1FG41_HELRO|nr:hypothetical protein HELRODRAFT_180640 [Helobdella robusta]ESN93772.1 hypothetical protein HELRODRAFT_180640 [Helobdella robusta]